MAVSRIQHGVAATGAAGSGGTAYTTLPVSLPAPATVGHLLVAAWGVDKASGAFTPPVGWTSLAASPGTSISLHVAYRIADGGETSAAATWATGVASASAVIAEYTGVLTSDPFGPTQLVADTVSDVTSMAFDPAAADEAGAALAFIAIDSLNVTSGSTTFRPASSGFSWVDTAFSTVNTSATATALVEDLTIADAEDIAPTFTWSRSDQAAGFIALLNESPGGPPTLVQRMVDVPTGTGVTMRVRTLGATSVRIKAGTNTALTTGVTWSSPATPDAAGFATLTLTGLSPGRHYYRVAMTDAGAVEHLDVATLGEFVVDDPGAEGNFAFCFSSCSADGPNDAAVAIAARRDDFFLHLGDFYYADGTGTDLLNFRARFDGRIAATGYRDLFATVPTAYIPSDHDGLGNDSHAGTDSTAWTNWNQVYRERIPAAGIPATTGVYRTFTHRRVRFILLDCRSFKGASGTTALGATQKQWLKDTITAATEPVIVIAQEGAWVGTGNGGDWSSYNGERNELAAFFAASGKNIAMLGGDMHALAAEDGTISPGGIPVFHGSPMNQAASIKGGPYTVGPYPASGASTVQQYGRMVVTDNGSNVALAFTGYSANGTTRVSQTTIMAVPGVSGWLVYDRATEAWVPINASVFDQGSDQWLPLETAALG